MVDANYAAYYWVGRGLWFVTAFAELAAVVGSRLGTEIGSAFLQHGVIWLVLFGTFVADRAFWRRSGLRSSGRYRYRTLERRVLGWRFVVARVVIVGIFGLLLVLLLAAGLVRWIDGSLLYAGYDRAASSAAELASLFVVISAASVAFARRELARQARHGFDGVYDADQRAPVLMLRSFGDDSLTLRTRRGFRHGLADRLSFRRFDRFEDIVAWTLWDRGPVVAIAQPGTKLPPLGAARGYATEDDWQEMVLGLVRASSVIGVLINSTEWLTWEINAVSNAGALDRTIFVMPPVSDIEACARLERLRNTLGLPARDELAAQGRVLALVVGRDDRLFVLTSSVRDRRILRSGYSAGG